MRNKGFISAKALFVLVMSAFIVVSVIGFVLVRRERAKLQEALVDGSCRVERLEPVGHSRFQFHVAGSKEVFQKYVSKVELDKEADFSRLGKAEDELKLVLCLDDLRLLLDQELEEAGIRDIVLKLLTEQPDLLLQK